MRHGIISTDQRSYTFSGQMTLSIGDGLTLDTRYGYDASKRPQSLVRRRSNAARTGTIQVVFNKVNAPDLFTEIQKYEELAGVVGELWWDGKSEGQWCIRDVSISLAVDAVDIVYGVQISMHIAESYVTNRRTGKEKPVTVRLL